MIAADLLDPLPPVTLGSTTVLVDRARPVAVLREVDGSLRVVTWPDAPLPARTATARALAAPGCVWVVYAEEGSNPGATAVRISADAQVETVELGVGAVIGADGEGVWIGPDPYAAMVADIDEGKADTSPVPPAGIEDAPVESWQDIERAQQQASQTSAAPPETGSNWEWVAYSPTPQERAPVPTGAATVPTGAAAVRRVRPSGAAQEVTFSRVVSHVEEVRPGVVRALFHPTGPTISTGMPDEKGRPYRWVRRAAEIDVGAALPASVDLDALVSTEAEDGRTNRPMGPEAAAGDRVDLAGIAETSWSLHPLGEEQVAAAVAAVVERYAALDQPEAVFLLHDQCWHRVPSAYSDLDVRAEGAWPGVEVVVDFTYQPTPGQHVRLRRRTAVFDDAGVPIASPYLEEYLQADLGTADLDELPEREGRRQI